MKKMMYIWMLVVSLAALSCNKEVAPYKEGPKVGEVYVTAEAGRVSVFVETIGQWRVSSDADWLSLDVEGGLGKGSFTASWLSNESDMLDVKASRMATVTISSDARKTDYEFTIIQQGFYAEHELSGAGKDPYLSVEFEAPQAVKRTFVLCSRDGVLEGDVQTLDDWLQSFDVAVIGSEVMGSLPGVEIRGSDFKYLSPEDEYDAFVNLIEGTYNSDKSDNDWIIAGQFYHLSMMQTGYPSAPQWYPLNGRDQTFDADRYAWRNNLYDCLWMSERDYVVTYTGPVSYNKGEQGSWQADYVYMSRGLLAKVYSVEILDKPVETMEHSPICVTFNY